MSYRIRWKPKNGKSRDGIFIKVIDTSNNAFRKERVTKVLVLFDGDKKKSRVPYDELSILVLNTDIEIRIRVGRHETDWRDRRDSIFVSAYEEEEYFTTIGKNVLSSNNKKIKNFIALESKQMIENIFKVYKKNRNYMTTSSEESIDDLPEDE